MELQDFYKIVAVIAILVVALVSYYVGPFKGQINNPIEQVAEIVIKDETGLDINFDSVVPKKDASNVNQ